LVFWIFFYFFIFGLLLQNSFSYLDPDLGWHLKVGQEISQTRMIPHLNHFNYTYTGAWVDHEWLSNLLSFEIYNNFGYIALSVFFAAIILLSLILINRLTKKYFPKTPTFFLAALQMLGVMACLPHLGVRMQEFGFLFLLLELWIITEYNRKRSVKILFWLWPLIYLWTNMHGSFLLGVGLLFVWLALKLFVLCFARSRWGKYIRDIKPISPGDIKKFGLVTLGAGAMTLVTPYGPELYSFLGGYNNSFYLRVIEEWLPQFNFPYNYWQLSYLALALAVLGLFFRDAFGKRFIYTDTWRLALVFIFIYLGFSSRRHFPLMFVASFFFIIEAGNALLDVEKIKPIIKHWGLKLFIIICLLLAGAHQYANIKLTNSPFDAYCRKYPCEAVAYLSGEESLFALNLFNEYNWGGYLIWTYPTKKLFIDGRLPQAAYAGHTFVEEYLEFFKPETDYQNKLAEYDIQLIFLKTQDDKLKVREWERILFWIKTNSLSRPNFLRLYLSGSRDWKIIYQDSLATVYKKNK